MAKLNVRVHRKIVSYLDNRCVNRRKKRLNNSDFTIICNNCWGGYVYRRYGVPYLSPTVGLYFFASDFIKLCSDVKGYMQKPLEFIPYTESKYQAEIEAKGQTAVPIARLGDVEVVFLHYKTQEEAAEKWTRRAERINYENLIFKFSKMNGCGDEEMTAFDAFDFRKKIMFTPPDDAKRFKCAIAFKSAAGNSEITDDTSEYSRYINLTKLINSKRVSGTFMEGIWRDK